MEVLAVLDGDEIAFKCAAANEQRSIIATHIASGRKKEFKTRTELKGFIAGTQFKFEDFDVEDKQTPNTIAFACHSAKRMTENICDAVGAKHYQMFISGSDNFRLSLPLPIQYKSGREGMLRPIHLDSVKNYLKVHFNAVTTKGAEADDYLASRGYQGLKQERKGSTTRVLPCTQDKDARGVESWLYNPNTEETILIEGLGDLWVNDKNEVVGLGRKWFYHQLLIGDKTDTYKPTDICGKRYGEKSSFAALKDCKTDKECWEAIYATYHSWYPGTTTYVDWQGIERSKTTVEIMEMYAACAHMRRWQDDVINCHKILSFYGIIDA